MSLKIRKRIRSSEPFRLKKKSILDNFLQSFFFMLKIKNSQKRRNINVSKSLITCYLSQTSSIFLGPVDLFIMFFAVQEMNNCPIQRKRS